jgi:hypothetical protein
MPAVTRVILFMKSADRDLPGGHCDREIGPGWRMFQKWRQW